MNKFKHDTAYKAFSRINGKHSYREAADGGYVDYAARTRPGGKVFYFNFDLAKEIGLISKNHPEVLSAKLTRSVLHTFSLEIINEYDILHNRKGPEKNIRPHKYMATRYLQCQHPDQRGTTSGDGRSIWNGVFKGRNATWDFSSCGTGATKLSPATAIEKKFFKTGSKAVSYGCGRSDLIDGVCEAVMSEIFHVNHVKTTRVLAVIAFKDGTSINIRVSKNLLRPAHFFHHLKQSNYESLKGAIDYYVDRQIENKEWPKLRSDREKYKYLLKIASQDFARAAAQFESEYIFCWMDWDGDNILADGGIIDYGSVRQFGLYHHEYRYDDVQRMSTSIIEQKKKAKYIVQTFGQIVDYLLTKQKKNIRKFNGIKALKEFDRVFEQAKDEAVLYKMGLPEKLYTKILKTRKGRSLASRFRQQYEYFEKIKSKRGPYKVNDGITWDAVFCMRDIMRELPKYYLQGVGKICAEYFIDILKSDYASRKDAEVNSTRRVRTSQFQKCYWDIVELAASTIRKTNRSVLKTISRRSDIINRYERVTGDAIIHISGKIIKSEKKLDSRLLHKMIVDFVNMQIMKPELVEDVDGSSVSIRSKNVKKIFQVMMNLVKESREGI